MSQDGITITDGGSFNIGSAEQGNGRLTKSFTVKNTGTADLTLEPLSVTGYGFSLESTNFTPGQKLAPDETATFTVGLERNNLGSFSGNVSFLNSDSDENPFNFAVSGTIVQPQPEGVYVIDNGDDGFSTTGSWGDVAGYGYSTDLLTGNGVNGVDTAQWVFDGLTAGEYDVATTWLRAGDRANAVPYVIRDGIGGNVLASVTADHTKNPIGEVFGGRPFEVLGTVILTGDTLVVELSTLGTVKTVIADAVRIQKK